MMKINDAKWQKKRRFFPFWLRALDSVFLHQFDNFTTQHRQMLIRNDTHTFLLNKCTTHFYLPLRWQFMLSVFQCSIRVVQPYCARVRVRFCFVLTYIYIKNKFNMFRIKSAYDFFFFILSVSLRFSLLLLAVLPLKQMRALQSSSHFISSTLFAELVRLAT